MGEKRYPFKWLTTSDNPFHPWKDFDKWYHWDISHGYYTSEYIMRIADVDLNQPPYLQQMDVNAAVDEIYALNLTGNYVLLEDMVTADEL